MINDKYIDIKSDYIKIVKKGEHLPTLVAFTNAGVPKGKFKPYKAILNVEANIIFLNDKNYRWYTGGIDGLTDNCENSAVKIVEMAREIGNGKVYTFGSSMGAFGATLYAMLGNADGCLAFSLESKLGYEGSRSSRSKYIMENKNIIKYNDLKLLIQEKKVPLTLFVPENDESDLFGAHHILHLENIKITSIRGSEHPGLQLFQNGDLEKLVNEYVRNGSIISSYQRRGTIFENPDCIPEIYNIFRKKNSLTKQDWLNSLLELSQQWPTVPFIQLRLGEAYYANGHPQGAELSWRKTIELSDYQYEAYVKLGSLLRRKGQLKEALSLIEKGIEINPLFAHGYANLGLVYFDLQQFDLAEKFARKAIEINGGNIGFQKNLAKILVESAKIKMTEANDIYLKLTK
ncbi:tetratricopeptide repeat protein [Bacillus taeanensis]|uniref:Uncharacterized protein n=1 Tax=Bacillus taeanensis TaxID=273032 RepID=A0A366XSN3_9BACI|nr:tetratricopeptide repeat protein [Bacillus taeanensis]RBW68897.1 hypothetical protein DS031_14265 [Bacillus taeanensis]